MDRPANALAIVALAIALGVSVGAQGAKWAEPYQKGVKAFEQKKYDEAVAQLERAVAADPKAGANKVIEGVFRTDYFPYYYLALSYLELQQYAKAQENLDKARPTLNRQQTARFNDAETKLKTVMAANQPPARNPAFDNGVRQAEAA